MHHRSAISLIAALALYGCGSAPRQAVTPVANLEGREVCILENLRVNSDFLDAYKKALENKGYVTRVLPTTARIDACPITSRYRALWNIDLLPYMSYAEIIVYGGSKTTGRAVYDATGVGATMSKFISAETKITELVNQLFKN